MTEITRRRLQGTGIATLLVGWAGVAGAQAPAGPAEPAGLAVTGRVEVPTTYSITGLATLPSFEIEAPAQIGQMARFVGPMLWSLIVAARPIPGPTPTSNLDHVVFARSAAGLVVAVAFGEIDPDYEGKSVLVAYKQDGVVLAVPRLVVPGDRLPGRNLPGLVALDVQ
jgi:hypothetical protein